MVSEVSSVIDRIVEVCRRNAVRCLWLFGSATGRSDRPFRAESDIDLLVEFGPLPPEQGGWLHPLFTMHERIEPIVGRHVQITENGEFRNPYFRAEVLRTRELIYDDAHEQASLGHR